MHGTAILKVKYQSGILILVPYGEIIKRIRKLSPRLQIGDFGCGEAKNMESIGENRVYSFDHVAINVKVVACDMKKVPLADEALDVAIFSFLHYKYIGKELG